MPRKKELPIYIHIDAYRAATMEMGHEAAGILTMLVTYVWAPKFAPFEFNTDEIVRLLAGASSPSVTAADLERHKAQLVKAFLVHDDGRWEPSPLIFTKPLAEYPNDPRN